MTTDLSLFETTRPQLTGVAYRLLGTLSDAEDAVQETFARWAETDQKVIRNPAAWMTTVCTRICLDTLRAKKRSRIDYVGDWLPEPVLEENGDNPERSVELASSLSMAFLLVLERLSPKERAAYLLREIFDFDYAEIAITLESSETACRQLVSRAKSRIGNRHVRQNVPEDKQRALLAAFQAAVQSGDIDDFASHLADDVRLSVDSGGKVPAIRRTLNGANAVTDFLRRKLGVYWNGCSWRPIRVNRLLGYELTLRSEFIAIMTFGYDENGRINDVLIVRNPEKIPDRCGFEIH